MSSLPCSICPGLYYLPAKTPNPLILWLITELDATVRKGHHGVVDLSGDSQSPQVALLFAEVTVAEDDNGILNLDLPPI